MWYAGIAGWIFLCVSIYGVVNRWDRHDIKDAAIATLMISVGIVFFLLMIGALGLIFLFIPEKLFGDIGLAGGLIAMLSILLYGVFFEEAQSKTKAFINLMAAGAIIVPILVMIAHID